MDRCLKMFDVPTGIETIIGDHEKPIKCVVHNPVDSKYCLLCVREEEGGGGETGRKIKTNYNS